MSIDWSKYSPIFSKNENDFMKNLQKLPTTVLMYCILPCIPEKKLMLTCKKHYLNNHKLKEIVPIYKTETYIRTIIRQDLDFVLHTLLVENYLKWVNMTHYKYKSWTYNNYIDFISSYCIEHESNKCLLCINQFILHTSLQL